MPQEAAQCRNSPHSTARHNRVVEHKGVSDKPHVFSAFLFADQALEPGHTLRRVSVGLSDTRECIRVAGSSRILPHFAVNCRTLSRQRLAMAQSLHQ